MHPAMLRAFHHLRAAQREILALARDGMDVETALEAIRMTQGCVRFARHLDKMRTLTGRRLPSSRIH